MASTGPVFILGSPRSGTTLLHSMLMSAGGFAVYCSEFHAYNGLGPRFRGLRSREQRERFLEEWLGTEAFLRTGLPAEQVRELVEERCRSAADLLREVMGAVAERQGAATWVDSTPENGLFLREIARDFPEARVVHMVRDPRDVAASLGQQRWVRSLPGYGGRPLLAAAAYWAWIVGRIQTDARALEGRYLELRFEELLGEPERALERVGGFLGRPLDLDRIRGAGVGAVGAPNTSHGDGEARRGFDPRLRWRRRMTTEEAAEVEAIAAGPMAALGYEAESTPAERPRLALVRAAYTARFAFRTWLKLRTPLAARFAYAPVLDWAPEEGVTDPTLRPGEHLERVRAIVGGQEPSAGPVSS